MPRPRPIEQLFGQGPVAVHFNDGGAPDGMLQAVHGADGLERLSGALVALLGRREQPAKPLAAKARNICHAHWILLAI